jgi:hypothetical protein
MTTQKVIVAAIIGDSCEKIQSSFRRLSQCAVENEDWLETQSNIVSRRIITKLRENKVHPPIVFFNEHTDFMSMRYFLITEEMSDKFTVFDAIHYTFCIVQMQEFPSLCECLERNKNTTEDTIHFKSVVTHAALLAKRFKKMCILIAVELTGVSKDDNTLVEESDSCSNWVDF